MKRLIVLLLALLLLAGCTVEEPDPTTVPTTEPTQPTTKITEPTGASLYQPDSTLEQSTAGAIKCYGVLPDCNAVYPMGDNLLVFYTGDQTMVHVYTGEELRLVNEAILDIPVAPGNLGVQISAQGMSYYDSDSRQVVLLDANLTEKKRLTLPENTQGTPAVDPMQTKAYFCTETEIRSMDLNTGIAGLLRQESVVWQSVYDVCFDGKVLLCDVIDQDQNGYLAYINTENGKLMDKDSGGWDVNTYGEAFLLHRSEDTGDRALYGTWDGETVNFVPAGEGVTIWSLLPMGGAVAVYHNDGDLVLDYYTLESGLRSASVVLSGDVDAQGFAADGTGNSIWFLLTDPVTKNSTLCRWDVTQSAVKDETVYLLPRYTELAPDVDGLNQCQAEADGIAAANGMEIRLWKDAVKAPWNDLRSDFRVSSFRTTLEMLKQALEAFPEGMISKLAPLSDSSVTSVSLVRGDSEEAQAYFKWVDGSIYIALETGANDGSAFYNALYRAMDTYILNSNSILDEWDSLDPVNDRAMYFQYAMSSDQQEFFADEYNQAKLAQLCKAIRYAFGLREYEGDLLWEQYLIY